jgi:hypothetical protein
MVIGFIAVAEILRRKMTSDFGETRYCNKCGGEIVREGDCITMYEGKMICGRTKDKPYCQNDMKPITKKYASKDLNIAYANGVKDEQKRIFRLLTIFYENKMKEKKLTLEDWYSSETISGMDLEEFVKQITSTEEEK